MIEEIDKGDFGERLYDGSYRIDSEKMILIDKINETIQEINEIKDNLETN